MTRRAFFAAIAALQPENRDVWLKLDLLRGTEQNRFPGATPICFGSLLKPFLALAFSSTHPRFPVIHCAGSSTRCWYSRGHGPQDIVSALSNSCNTYFLALAKSLDRAALDETALRFGLVPPDRALPVANLIGLSSGWPQAPGSVARAFASLAQQSADPVVATVLSGMARCARTGTARRAGFSCYAKTGTAPCSHVPRAPGDGFALAIYPPGEPRHVLLLGCHSTTGAHAASKLKPIAASLV